MLVSDQVFRTLLEALLEGRYAPGEKLPTQRALAADLDVTMSSVREALKRLEQMGLVDVRQGDAMRVRDWRAHGGLDVVRHLVLRSGAVDPGVLGDVLEARELMLRELARLAAQRRDDAEAARLVELAATFAATDDPTAAQAIDFAFFAAVAEAARNIVFVLILNAIRDAYFAHADARAGHRRPARAGAALHAPGGRDRAPRRRRGRRHRLRPGRAADGVGARGARAMTAREADIFRCLVDTVVAPADPVARTDADAFFADWLDHAPALNRAGIRALLYALELAPLAAGAGARLRRLDGRAAAGGAAADPRHRVRRRRRRRRRDRAALLLRRRRGDALARLRRGRGHRALPRPPRREARW